MGGVVRVAVLIGGVGRRIGGEKTEVRVCGRKLLEIAIEKYSDYDTIYVCRDEEQVERLSREYSCRFVTDIYRNFGSIAGIHAALNYFEDCMVTAIDMPFVKKNVIEHLYRTGRKLRCDALLPKHEKGIEPLLAYYSRSALREIERAIQANIRMIARPLENLNTVYYPADNLRKLDKNLISFFNINTKEDLERAERLCSEIDTEGP